MFNFKNWLAESNENKIYPSLKWIKRELRMNRWANTSSPVLAAYIVGSEAKGTAKSDSDIDIAVVVPQNKNLSAIKKT